MRASWTRSSDVMRMAPKPAHRPSSSRRASKIGELRLAAPSHDGAAMRPRLHEAAARDQQSEGFAHRRARDIETLGEFHLVKRRAGRQRAAHGVVRDLHAQAVGQSPWHRARLGRQGSPRAPRCSASSQGKGRCAHWRPFAGSSMRLTCAATTRQPSGKRTQVCICRPTLPGMLSRWNRVEATAQSRP